MYVLPHSSAFCREEAINFNEIQLISFYFTDHVFGVSYLKLHHQAEVTGSSSMGLVLIDKCLCVMV